MPLYNVEVTKTTIMVVNADDKSAAYFIAKDQSDQAFDDDFSDNIEVSVIGEIMSASDLREGWDEYCCPYSENEIKKISDILKGE